MKTTIKMMTITMLVLFIASAFSIQNNDDPVKAEKKARIKMITNVDGVVTEIDTVLTDFNKDNIDEITNVFIKSHTGKSGCDSLSHTFTFDFDGSGKSQKICKIITSDDSEEIVDMDISTICKADSIIKNICVTTGDDGKPGKKKVMIFKGDGGCSGEPFIYSAKGMPQVKMMKMKDDENVIRLDDKSIVSFKKKDLGGNKEKIEIIREKKSE